jgi:hypothetical protein
MSRAKGPSSLPLIPGECFAGIGGAPRTRDIEVRQPGPDARPCLAKFGLGLFKIVAGAAVVGERRLPWT